MPSAANPPTNAAGQRARTPWPRLVSRRRARRVAGHFIRRAKGRIRTARRVDDMRDCTGSWSRGLPGSSPRWPWCLGELASALAELRRRTRGRGREHDADVGGRRGVSMLGVSLCFFRSARRARVRRRPRQFPNAATRSSAQPSITFNTSQLTAAAAASPTHRKRGHGGGCRARGVGPEAAC